MPQLRQYQREHVFTLLLKLHVARQLGAHQATICCLWKRPCDTAHLHDRFLRSVETAATKPGTNNRRTHRDTVRNWLLEHGI